jgi:hypothetical protein
MYAKAGDGSQKNVSIAIDPWASLSQTALILITRELTLRKGGLWVWVSPAEEKGAGSMNKVLSVAKDVHLTLIGSQEGGQGIIFNA